MGVMSLKPVRCLDYSETDEGYQASILWIAEITADTGFQQILNDSRLPKAGEPYRFNGDKNDLLYRTTAQCKFKDEENSRQVVNVVVNYSTAPTNSDTGKDQEERSNPLDMRPKVRIITSRERKPILYDLDGQLITSSAGEPYDPVCERDNTRAVLQIIRNVSRNFWGGNVTFKDSVNSQPIFGYPAGVLKMEVPGAWELMYYANGRIYFQETWEMAFADKDQAGNWLTWQLSLYDYGTYQIINNKRFNLVDWQGNDLTAPAPLDGAAAVLEPGQPPVLLPDKKRYITKDFNAILPALPDFWV